MKNLIINWSNVLCVENVSERNPITGKFEHKCELTSIDGTIVPLDIKISVLRKDYKRFSNENGNISPEDEE